MALTSGKKLGPYEIVAPLGAGGMGEVYEARDTRLERTVAIKILPAHLSNDPVRRQRFEREAKAVSSLNHPHICTLYDIGCQDGLDFIVMEYVEGITLASRLEKGPLPTAELLEYGIQLASALDKAHRNGVTHRDLKPGNIMLTKSGTKLLDFGLAKATAPPLAAGVTQTNAGAEAHPMTKEGAVIGTVPYMSPEQVEGKEVDGRSDIFSLGAVLYECLGGRKAFTGPGAERFRRGVSDFGEGAGADQYAATADAARAGADDSSLPGERPGRALAVGGRSLQGTAVDYGERVAKRRDADCIASPTGLEARDRVEYGDCSCGRGGGIRAGHGAAEPAGRAWPGGARFSATEFSARGGFPGGIRGERHRGV